MSTLEDISAPSGAPSRDSGLPVARARGAAFAGTLHTKHYKLSIGQMWHNAAREEASDATRAYDATTPPRRDDGRAAGRARVGGERRALISLRRRCVRIAPAHHR